MQAEIQMSENPKLEVMKFPALGVKTEKRMIYELVE